MISRPGRRALVAAGCLAAGLAGQAAAVEVTPASALPAGLKDVAIEQRIGQGLPLDVPFRDEQGRHVRLGDYFGDKPVLIMPVYYRCPMLCPLALDGMTRALKVLTFVAGADYELVVFSINPDEVPYEAKQRKDEALAQFDRPGGDSWHFLTGKEESIERLTRALGFRYAYDVQSGEYVHASTLVVATPEGRISRYLYTTEPAPKDLRFALVEGSEGRLGTPADAVLLYCFQYDATTGKYTVLTMRLVRGAAAVTVVALALFIGYMVRQEKRGTRLRAVAGGRGNLSVRDV